ncbi:MAG: TetR/AcrR family transcriptional regulator [Streptosporangiaceae bacterium]
MSATPPDRPTRARGYHHGDLRASLIDIAVELISQRGVRNFSVAEASRRLGVTVAAPYRHFADRDELLAAVAVRALERFGMVLTAAMTDAGPPADRLAAMAGGYVRFAAGQRPLFEAAFASGIDKSRHPEVRRAEEPVEAAFMACVREVCDGDEAAAEGLGDAVQATAHGCATLLLDGGFGAGDESVGAAVALAERATAALIAGHRKLG